MIALDKYGPQCGGWCAFGMIVEDKFPVAPTRCRVLANRLLAGVKLVSLIVLAGNHAFERYAGEKYNTLTDAVRTYNELLLEHIVRPHTFPRNNMWQKKLLRFESEFLVAIQKRAVIALRSPRVTIT